MKKNEALTIAAKCIQCIESGKINSVWDKLLPVLNARTAFHMLDLIGREIGERILTHKSSYLDFFDQLSGKKLMGGYVIIARALISLLPKDFKECFARAKRYIIEGDEWYVCDIFGERILGYAIIDHYDKALPLFRDFSRDDNHWVRRSVGVAAHYFAKNCREAERDNKKATEILELLAMQICERDIRIMKGIGWGLKTLGRYYPELLVPFMKKQIREKQISALIIRKSIMYLNKTSKNEILHLHYGRKTDTIMK